MRASWRGLLVLGLAVVVACGDDDPDPVASDRPRVLVFHHTAGYRHVSIPDAVAAIERGGERRGVDVEATDDPQRFTARSLARFDALVFLDTTGNVLPERSQRAALQSYVSGGGGYLGIHAAADMGDEVRSTWPWYRRLVGAAFKGHTAARLWSATPIDHPSYTGPLAEAPSDAEVQVPDAIVSVSWEPAEIVVEDLSSPAMAGWSRRQVRSDEWYGFLENPRPRVHVLARVDESTFDPAEGAMGADHPIAWCQRFDGGRSVYTAMGHPSASWSDRRFLRHVLGAIEMAAGTAPFNC